MYPLFLSYLLSFSLIFTYWRSHHFIASVLAKNIDTKFTNLNAVFNSDLNMHAAGFLSTGGIITERGATVHYWSSDTYSITHARAYVIPTLNGAATTSTNDKDAGFSVRCIRD